VDLPELSYTRMTAPGMQSDQYVAIFAVPFRDY
jgi:hypothetical protein